VQATDTAVAPPATASDVVIDMLDNSASPSAVWSRIKHQVDTDAHASSHSTAHSTSTSAAHANPLCMDHHDAVAPDAAPEAYTAASASPPPPPPPPLPFFHNSFTVDARDVACSLTDDPDARLGSIAELRTPRCDEQHELYTPPRTTEEEGGGGEHAHAQPLAFDVMQLGSPYMHDAAAFLQQVATGTAQLFPHAAASPSSSSSSGPASPPPPEPTAVVAPPPPLLSPSPPPAHACSASVDTAGGVGILALSPSIDRLFRYHLTLTEETQEIHTGAPPPARPQHPNANSTSPLLAGERRPPLPAARGSSPQREPARLRTAAAPVLSPTLPAAASAATPLYSTEAQREREEQRSECEVESGVEPDEEETVLGRRRTLAMRPFTAALSTGSPSESPRPPLFLQPQAASVAATSEYGETPRDLEDEYSDAAGDLTARSGCTEYYTPRTSRPPESPSPPPPPPPPPPPFERQEQCGVYTTTRSAVPVTPLSLPARLPSRASQLPPASSSRRPRSLPSSLTKVR